MKLTFLGTGCSVASARRNNTCLSVQSGETRVLIDAHSGISQSILKANQSFHDLEHIILTHRHMDHVSGLLQLLFEMRNWHLHCGLNPTERNPLHFHSTPEAIDFVKGLITAGGKDTNDRFFPIRWINHEGKPFTIGDIDFTPFPVTHGNLECHGFVIADKGEKRIVYSADTSPCEAVLENCREGDILIHECDKVDRYDAGAHTSLAQIEEFLPRCKAEKIYLVHLPQTMSETEEATITQRLKEQYGDRLQFAYDLQSFTV